MPVPVPTIVCGRCGTPFIGTAVCGNCGHPTATSRPLDTGAWRAQLRPAERGRVLGAAVADTLCLVVPTAALAVATALGGWHAWAVVLVCLVILGLLVALGLWCLRGWGRFAGGALLGLRTLDGLTGLAPDRFVTPDRLLVADARNGADPLVIAVPRPAEPGTGAGPAPQPAPVRAPQPPPAPRPHDCFVAAGQSLTPLTGTLLVGRYPVRQLGAEPLPTLELPDFTRTMSRTHVLLENENGRLWATDLGSGNGTRIQRPGEPSVTMTARLRMPVVLGTRIDCGEQSLLITDGRRAAA